MIKKPKYLRLKGIFAILTLCVTPLSAHADPASLSWWFLPNSVEDLPHEVEEDSVGIWNELWERPTYDSETQPTTVMEQAIGAKWVGLAPDKEGKPNRIVLVLAGRKIVELTGDQAKWGSLDDEKITWNDGTKEPLHEFRRRRGRRRRGRAAKIKFEATSLPPLASKVKNLNVWGGESLDGFLTKLESAPDVLPSPRDLSAVAQIADPNGSVLNFRYADTCSFKERQKIEDALSKEVEPKVTCWMDQNVEAGSKLLAALLQRPLIDCHARAPMTSQHCAMATVPHVEAFFPTVPRINVALSRCEGELGVTLLHELFHLAGVKEKPELLLAAVQDSESCQASPPQLDFSNEGEGFYNDFEVQTRITLFRKVRDESEKWGWTDAEKAFMLGTICNKMGDKYCSRNFFQKAAEGNLQGMVSLPEGSEVSWSSLAQFEFFDSISEDIQRMHELVRYLHRDPNGTLLRRIETGTHRLHEFFVARQALEAVIANHHVCSSETDEHVLCEDLALIAKTPWFRNP